MVAPRALIVLVFLLLTLVCPRPAGAQECVIVEDFSKGTIGELPPGWKLRKDSGRGVYSLREEGGLRFLHATARGIGIQAAKQYEWDLSAYPILAWSWRPIEFPTGSDERKTKTNDSVLAVYAVFPHTSWSVKSVKYIWSAEVPVGTRLTSSKGLTHVRVLRSGTRSRDTWVEERANVLDDYRASFDTKDVPKPVGIAVLTDSDDTGSSAQGDYANVRACKP
jgi:hypothetical protein